MLYETISFVMLALLSVTLLFVCAYCLLGFASTIIDIVKFLKRKVKRI